MAKDFSGVTHDDILRALADLEGGAAHPFRSSIKWDLLHDGSRYPPKAVLGLAVRRSWGRLGTPRDFSGGEEHTSKVLRGLGFDVVRKNDAAPDALVLVEAERTEGGRYDHWEDITGERYQFPNTYKNRVRSGLPFVYYRGVRRTGGGRGTPEYFGHGRIGAITRDPTVATDAPKKDWTWFCEIENYVPFLVTVPTKVPNGSNREGIVHQNLWGVAVRPLSREHLFEILAAAGEPFRADPASNAGNEGRPDEGGESIPPSFPPLATPREGAVLRARAPAKGISSGAMPRPQGRRSRFAKAIGDRAEAVVMRFLELTVVQAGLGTELDHPASRGVTPGWVLGSEPDYVNNGGMERAA